MYPLTHCQVNLLNQARAGEGRRQPGFLKSLLCGCMCGYVDVCVSAPGLLKTIHVK